MSELVFFLEEASAKAMLEGLLPRIVPGSLIVRYFHFEGKQDLEKHLVKRLRGYLAPDARFIILRDQDSGDCVAVRERLKSLCAEAGRPEAMVRIACRELESWYLADLAAVAEAYGTPAVLRESGRAKYRDPDMIEVPSGELRRLVPEYQKVDGSRRIGAVIDPNNRRSRSFAHLVGTIRRIAGAMPSR